MDPATAPQEPENGGDGFKASPVPLTDPAVLESLQTQIIETLGPWLAHHEKREKMFASFLQLYKSKPEHEVKTFPFENAANVVVPIVAIAVDSIQARLVKAVLGQKDIVEVTIRHPDFEPHEKKIRDYLDNYFRVAGLAAFRKYTFDMALYGDGYVKLVWEKKVRTSHFYDANGAIASREIVEFEGCKQYCVSPADIIRPSGYESWDDVPWFAHRLRFTWQELKMKEKEGLYTDVERVKAHKTKRRDKVYEQSEESKGLEAVSDPFFTVYEIHGKFEVPPQEGEAGESELMFTDVIAVWHDETRTLLSAVYNPYFGRARHLVKIPFLEQPHELDGLGLAEQLGQFQASASASHNQVLDAGTVANAGLIVTTPSANFGENENIYPGKRITTDKPREDVQVIHLGASSPVLGMMENRAMQYAEKRSGVGAYQMGQESPIVGSQATATGTTALIAEGNTRFWISIDDMRRAIEDILYLSLQQEQQFRPQGTPLPDGTVLKLPQQDVRTSLGLRLTITSETMNRELELRNIQMLIQMLNEYYMRLMQASAILQNPQFPPLQKTVILQIMNSAHDLMRRIVERFDMENVDTIVPNLVATMQQALGALNGQMGMAPQGAGLPQQQPSGLPPGGGAPGAGQAPGGGQPAGDAAVTGSGPIIG